MHAYCRVTRGGITESLHRNRVAVVDAAGKSLLEAGDVGVLTFLRSSWKPIQCLGLVSSGAAEVFGLVPHEIAVCSASHSGQAFHLEAVRSVLRKAGLDESHLACGAHWPACPETTAQLKAAGLEPTDIHNNCSGKHAGMLARCAHLGLPTEDYTNPEHPVQRMIFADAAEMCQTPVEDFVIGVDGCTAPVWAIPLRNAALGWARFGAGASEDPKRAAACGVVAKAIAENPRHIGGDGRLDTRIMQVTHGRVLCKGGAEACVGACVPSEGIGVAIKTEDGRRGTMSMLLEVLRHLDLVTDAEMADLADIHQPPVTNCNQIECGRIIPELTDSAPEDAWSRNGSR